MNVGLQFNKVFLIPYVHCSVVKTQMVIFHLFSETCVHLCLPPMGFELVLEY